MTNFNPLDHPICYAYPMRLAPSGWIGHIPFAMYAIDILRPRVVVELGTHNGVSYCAFCQAVKELKTQTLCYAVDTWQGDAQAGLYGPEVLADLRQHHDSLYGCFSRLIQTTFDDALSHFENGTIDLLHIDGYHSYQAVKHDFETWLPKMSNRGVMLFHDINVREGDFGVWRVWKEVRQQYPYFEFVHAHGLGVLAVGQQSLERLKELFKSSKEQLAQIREFFYQLGSRLEATQDLSHLKRVAHEQTIAYETQLAKRLQEQTVAYETELAKRLQEQSAAHETELAKRLQEQSVAYGTELTIRLEEQSAEYETQLAGQLEDLSKIRTDYEAQIKQQADQLSQVRSGFEARLTVQTKELSNLQSAWSSSLKASRQAADLNASLLAQLDGSESVIRAHDEVIASLQRELTAKTREVHDLTRSLGWQLLSRYGRFKYRYLLPIYRRLGLPYLNIPTEDQRLIASPEDQKAPIAIRSAAKPLLSVIIPVFNNSAFTIGCLNSIKERLEQCELRVEVIIVDDNSTDNTKAVLTQYTGIRTITNEKNVGFIASCNRGASMAQGEYLLFLNNDTIVQPRCFEELLNTFQLRPDAGLVGAKLLYPDGRLQEAGGIIWNDGSAWNYGRMDDPDKPEYSYLREVDYCSGACLAVPRDLFERLHGFDSRYQPAYCEDSDLAFRVREMGYKVYYQPLAQVIHFEGATSGTDTSESVKRYQVVNQQKLFAQWSKALLTHGDPGTNPYTAKERNVRKRILVVDARILLPDQDAGSLTVFNHIKIFQTLGYKVTFAPDNLKVEERYTSDLQRLGVECLHLPHTKSICSHLEAYGSYYDLVFIARAEVASIHIDNVKTYCRNAKIIFDTEDLHFVREERLAGLENDAELGEKALQRKIEELTIAEKADCTIVVSPYERQVLLKENPNLNVTVIPVPREIPGLSGGFERRRDILFIGGFEHPPNVDGVIHFVLNTYPLIKQQLPDLKFYVLGSKPTPEVLNLATDPSIIVTGYVDDLAPYFNQIRLSIAPLRYGAGIKGKILTSLSYGLPVVASNIAAEGIGLQNEVDVLCADSSTDFAKNVVRLYTNTALWNKLSANGLARMRTHYSMSAATAVFRQLFTNLTRNGKAECGVEETMLNLKFPEPLDAKSSATEFETLST